MCIKETILGSYGWNQSNTRAKFKRTCQRNNKLWHWRRYFDVKAFRARNKIPKVHTRSWYYIYWFHKVNKRRGCSWHKWWNVCCCWWSVKESFLFNIYFLRIIFANLNTEQKCYSEILKIKITNQRINHLKLSPGRSVSQINYHTHTHR